MGALHDGVVFLSETNYPVRSARVDGRPVEPLTLNFVFTGLPVTAGAHVVELKYEKGSFRVGAGISAITLGVWTILAGRARRSRR